MALWREKIGLTVEEKKTRDEARRNDIVRSNSFYTGKIGYRAHERIESADNRRAAGVYVNNF